MPIPVNWHPWKAATNPVTRPDVWHQPATGMEWCDCGEHCKLTHGHVALTLQEMLGTDWLTDRITHRQVILLAMRVWNYRRVCRFFTLAVEDAAVYVNGTVADDYPAETGLAIVKAFSDRWNGCPTEGCKGEWTAEDIEMGGAK